MTPPALSFADVTKEFPLPAGNLKVRALDRFSLSISAGEIVALLGPNGSGKSTAIKLALGLLRPTHGEVCMGGESATSLQVRQRVGYVPDVGGLPLHLSGREVLEWWAKMNDLEPTDTTGRVHEALAELDLQGAADRRVAEYSRGMQKRLALAQAILPQPQVLLLDEPFAGLDPMAIDRQVELFQRMRSGGCAILFSSHLLSRVEELVDRVVLIHRGRTLAVGTPAELVGAEPQPQRGLDDVFRERMNQAAEAEK